MGRDKIPPDQARKFPGPLWCLRFSVAHALCGRLVSFPRGPEISALCASWLSSELGLSLVQILMAAPLPSGLLTDPHQAAPASQRSGCLHPCLLLAGGGPHGLASQVSFPFPGLSVSFPLPALHTSDFQDEKRGWRLNESPMVSDLINHG